MAAMMTQQHGSVIIKKNLAGGSGSITCACHVCLLCDDAANPSEDDHNDHDDHADNDEPSWRIPFATFAALPVPNGTGTHGVVFRYSHVRPSEHSITHAHHWKIVLFVPIPF